MLRQPSAPAFVRAAAGALLPLLPLLAALASGCCAGHPANHIEQTQPISAGRITSAAGVAQTRPADSASSGTDAASKGSNDSGEESDETAWKAVSAELARTGSLKADVYVVTVPREDLSVGIEGMEVPTSAGIESAFSFYHCSCGKTSVVGQFCVTDYEANDVVDALRAGRIEVASMAPMLLHARTNPLLIRFQGEGKAGPLAKTLREALRWTGKERMAPQTLPGQQ